MALWLPYCGLPFPAFIRNYIGNITADEIRTIIIQAVIGYCVAGRYNANSLLFYLLFTHKGDLGNYVDDDRHGDNMVIETLPNDMEVEREYLLKTKANG